MRQKLSDIIESINTEAVFASAEPNRGGSDDTILTLRTDSGDILFQVNVDYLFDSNAMLIEDDL